jgi:uncharacterized protein
VEHSSVQVNPLREWPATLDVSALLADGWHPVPFCQFVVKVHSRCNLACDYCYMYEMADQSWRDQPKRMSLAIAEQTAARIGEHVRAHGIAEITLVLHGGEPLLAGHKLIRHVLDAVRSAVGPGVIVRACVQTNGVGLDEAYLELFHELDVHVGVSLDGGEDAQDRHRRFRDGRESHAVVAAGLDRLRGPRFQHLFNGLLSVIDLSNDPLRTYGELLAFEPPRIDFLLPHGTWEAPPPGLVGGTPYADWLIPVFDAWYAAPTTQIRLFAEIMRLLLGRPAHTESVGLAPADFLVIETDGAIAQVDTLKAAFPGAPLTGLHVSHHAFDDALLLPEIAARQAGLRALCEICQKCRLVQVCGGGLYAHRYRPGTGFANPSVYCADLMCLIDHIRETVSADITQRIALSRAGRS